MATKKEVERLSDEFTLNGYTYKLVTRIRKKALYAQYNNGGILMAHELVYIKTLPPTRVFNRDYPEREHYPSNEEVGTLAWSITADPEKALKRFEDFVKFKRVQT